VFPATEGAARHAGRLHLERRAADDRGGARADGAAADDPARRAVDGPRAPGGRADLRDRERAEREGAHHLPHRGAEHHGGAPLRALRLHPRERARGDGRHGRAPLGERGREGVLPRALEWRAPQLSRREALPAAQALAGVSDFYDERERRDALARERELFDALPAQLEHAKRNAPYYAKALAEIDVRAVSDRAALAKLPLTRKSELFE